MSEIIQFSRRNFLIGTAATLAASALPSLPKAEQLQAILVEAQTDYVERHVQRIMVCPTSGPFESSIPYKVSVFLAGSENPWLIDAFDFINGWLFAPIPDGCPVLLRDQFMRVVLEPLNKVASVKSFQVGLIVDDKNEEGLWNTYSETHEFPSKTRSYCTMFPKPENRKFSKMNSYLEVKHDVPDDDPHDDFENDRWDQDDRDITDYAD